MQLTVTYKDNTRRIVNVCPEFFKDSEVRDRYKTTIVTTEEKAMDIALSGGAYPYEILLMEDGEVAYKHTNKANAPVQEAETKPRKEWHSFMQRSDEISEKEVKALRKGKFTRAWNPRTQPIFSTWFNGMSPFERGLRLMLTQSS